MPEPLSDQFRSLLHGFIHEVRNPMSAILTATALLRDPESLEEGEAPALLEVVDSESRRMNRVIVEFEHYLQLPPPSPEHFDLAARVARVLDDLHHQNILEGAVRIHNELPPGQQAFGDGEQIGEVLAEIFRNAAQAMQSSDRGTPVLEIRMVENSPKVILLICDNGEGFSRESAERAFEPFYSTRSGAFGLGLSLALAIMQNNGGNLEIMPPVSNQPGACLRLTIPVASQ